jgi:hypothetical protein
VDSTRRLSFEFSGSRKGCAGLPARHWHVLRGALEIAPGAPPRTALTVSFVAVPAIVAVAEEADGAAGSQQQPPTGSLGQQQPSRLIWAIRPGPVVSTAAFASPASSAPTVVNMTNQEERDQERETAISPGILNHRAATHDDPYYHSSVLDATTLYRTNSSVGSRDKKKTARRRQPNVHAGSPSSMHVAVCNPQIRSHAADPHNR